MMQIQELSVINITNKPLIIINIINKPLHAIAHGSGEKNKVASLDRYDYRKNLMDYDYQTFIKDLGNGLPV